MTPEQGTIAGLTVATAVAAADMFVKVLPPAHTIADQPATADAVADVHRQCRAVLPMALAFGAGAALLARSPWPLVGAAGAIAWMWWRYDAAVCNDPGPGVAGPTARRYGA